VVVREFVKLGAGDRRQQKGKGPVQFVHVEQRPFGPGLRRHGSPRRCAVGENAAVVEEEERPERVGSVAHGEDFVFRVARPNHVRRVRVQWAGGKIAGHVPVAGARGGKGLRHPKGKRERDVEVLGKNDVGQLSRGAVEVGFTGVPTPLRHVDPAANRETQLDGLRGDLDLLS